MKLMCSWCLSEGRVAYLGERGSLSDTRVSHVICEGHLVQLRAEVQIANTMYPPRQENQPSPSRKSKGFEISMSPLH